MGWIGDLLDWATESLPRKYYEGRDKGKLKLLLKEPNYPDGRSIETLSKKIGRDEEATRRLLNEMGATRFQMAKGGEGWRLGPRRRRT